ncbi:MAG: hypothetical protein RLZ04_2393, partial [Actinomycetota bacterium]
MSSRITHRGSPIRGGRVRVWRGRGPALAVGLALLAGCSGGSSEIASPFTETSVAAIDQVAGNDPSVTSPADASPSTSVTPTTDAQPTVTAPPGVATLAADGPWRLVESAPGVEEPGLVYELMPGLWAWLPVEEDLDAGIGWHLTEADVPVIEAYLQARLVYFEAATSRPPDADHPGLAEWYADGGQAVRSVLDPHVEAGEYADLDIGVVLRPSVVGDGRSDTSAVVVSCTLDGGVFLTADGELASGS